MSGGQAAGDGDADIPWHLQVAVAPGAHRPEGPHGHRVHSPILHWGWRSWEHIPGGRDGEEPGAGPGRGKHTSPVRAALFIVRNQGVEKHHGTHIGGNIREGAAKSRGNPFGSLRGGRSSLGFLHLFLRRSGSAAAGIDPERGARGAPLLQCSAAISGHREGR